jgi:hypothetical protein
MQTVSLDSLGGGALAELFAEELSRVLANIADPNTDDTSKRSITMTVTLAPNRDRDIAEVQIGCTSKLAGIMKVKTQLFIGRQAGKLVAVESDPRQTNLFDQPKPQLAASSVSTFPTGGNA